MLTNYNLELLLEELSGILSEPPKKAHHHHPDDNLLEQYLAQIIEKEPGIGLWKSYFITLQKFPGAELEKYKTVYQRLKNKQ